MDRIMDHGIPQSHNSSKLEDAQKPCSSAALEILCVSLTKHEQCVKSLISIDHISSQQNLFSAPSLSDLHLGARHVYTLQRLSQCTAVSVGFMASEQKHGRGALEQFISLAENLRGAALVSLINLMLEAPGVYAFGEFLDLPCVKELSEGPNDEYSKLLDLFAYGTYHDYKANMCALPALSEGQKNKLRHLTVATLAANTQCIPYSVLQEALEVASVRQLEDVLIEAVYSDVIRGKLDQCKQQLEVDACIGRDMRSKNTGELVQTLKDWCVGCESICCAIESQVHRVRQSRDCRLHTQQQVSTEVCTVRKMLTAAASSSSSSSASASSSSAAPQAPELDEAPLETECSVSLKNTGKSKNGTPKH